MILVTGATGSVGGQVASQLHAAGVDVRALVRDPEKAKRVLPDGVEAVRGDLTDPASLDAALDGVDAVFLMWPLFGWDGADEVVATIARHARRVVYLSTIGASDDDTSEVEEGILGFHTVLERLVRKSVPEWVTVRPGGFATNTLGWAAQTRAGDTVRMPYPGAARSMLHEADIAAVAVRGLLTDELLGTAPEFMGNDVLTQAEQVEAIGRALGRTLRVEETPYDEAVKDLVESGVPEDYAHGILEAHAEMQANPVPTDTAFAELMGRPPRTYGEWAADHAADFRG
ncbi:SDR family oxidoreductase [Streptomyces sp. NPDC048172]|uniref:SDR family oxidoreductase n=1 Tax=Streptomyces sp. NPDC048172 TaxID=3365505 RepID=UPI0037120BA2